MGGTYAPPLSGTGFYIAVGVTHDGHEIISKFSLRSMRVSRGQRYSENFMPTSVLPVDEQSIIALDFSMDCSRLNIVGNVQQLTCQRDVEFATLERKQYSERAMMVNKQDVERSTLEREHFTEMATLKSSQETEELDVEVWCDAVEPSHHKYGVKWNTIIMCLLLMVCLCVPYHWWCLFQGVTNTFIWGCATCRCQ